MRALEAALAGTWFLYAVWRRAGRLSRERDARRRVRRLARSLR